VRTRARRRGESLLEHLVSTADDVMRQFTHQLVDPPELYTLYIHTLLNMTVCEARLDVESEATHQDQIY